MLYELCWQGVGNHNHPDDLADSLSRRQIAGWTAWLAKEPRGERREDVRLAMLRHDVRAPHVDQAESPEDLLPQFADSTPLTPEVDQILTDFMRLPR